MVDITAHTANWIADIFSWEKMYYVATVISLIGAGTIVPIYQAIKKRHCKMKDEQNEKTEVKIVNIATDVSKKLESKLDQHIATQEELKDKIEIQDRDNKTIIYNLKELVSDFKEFKEEQQTVNAKVNYIDAIIRKSIKLDF